MTFKIGDEVETLRGNGVITDISTDPNHGVGVFLMRVTYPYSGHLWLTMDGKLDEEDQHPYAWHLETGTPPCVGEGPERKPWIPDGLTPCWVWDDGDESKQKALVFSFDNRAVQSYGVIINELCVSKFDFAEPLPKDEMPAWMKF